jgi:hypothetical protein
MLIKVIIRNESIVNILPIAFAWEYSIKSAVEVNNCPK